MSWSAGMNADSALDRTDIPRYRPLLIVLVAASAGIAADSYWPLSFLTWLTAVLLTLGIWYVSARRGHHRAAAGLILTAILSVAGAWHHCQWNLFDENDLGNYTAAKKQPVALDAVVLSAPRQLPPSEPSFMQSLRSAPGYRLEISAAAIRNSDKWQPVSGRALLFVQGDMPAIEPGDRIRIFGELSAPSPAHNPGEFDRAAFLRAHRIRSQIQSQSECISVLQTGSGWSLSRRLESVRKNAAGLFQRYLDPRQAELASAVFLGEREQIDSRRNEAFMATGTVHVLSISGLHVGILAGALFWIMRKMPISRVVGLILIILITGLYALMVDVNPPVVRATILVLVTCLSMCLRRPALSFNSLAAAALVVLAINPNDLFNVGAQLSFLCVAILIWVWPYWTTINKQEKLLQKMAIQHLDPASQLLWPVRDNIIYLAVGGGAIWLLTQPLVAARFHIFSPIALLTNILLWLPMTLGLLSGFVFLFIAAIVPPLAGVAAWCCNICLWLFEKMIDCASAAPGGHYWVSGPGNWWRC
jgi:competence protein ComEC